jgi:hypothetical protein
MTVGLDILSCRNNAPDGKERMNGKQRLFGNGDLQINYSLNGERRVRTKRESFRCFDLANKESIMF